MSTTTEQTTTNKLPKLDPIHRRNFILLLLGASVMSFGWAMPGVTRAPFVNWLGMSNKVYGLIGSSWALCMIGSFLFPWLSRRYPRKKWYQFVVAMPYLLLDLALGVAIIVAMVTNSYQWLLPLTIVLWFLWPLAAGWINGPQSEYIANCIPKTHIGRFVSMQQFCVGLVGLGGSAAITVLMTVVGVPARYALAFMLAYVLALTAYIIPLFAHETPSPSPPPEPFWKPAAHAVRRDKHFRSMLGAGMILWFAVLLPQQFIPLLGIREWGAPDWIAASAATVQSATMLAGAALAGVLGQKFTYGKSLLICMIALPIAMGIGAWPVSSAFRGDMFEGAYEVTSDRIIVESSPGKNVGSNSAFKVVGLVAGRKDANELFVRFSKPVDPSSFTVYDVVIKDSEGRQYEPQDVKAVGKRANEWAIKLAPSGRVDSKYRLWLQPYINDKAGRMLDQNGDSRSPFDAYKVLIIAGIWGLAFSGLSVGLETLMYQLSPPERRSGYFSAFRIVQFAAPAIAFPLSGIMFKTGQFAGAFFTLLIFSIGAIVISQYLLRPVVTAQLSEAGSKGVTSDT